MTGHRGALATVERKLHDVRINKSYMEIMALTRHRGEGATKPGGLRRGFWSGGFMANLRGLWGCQML
ncbi:MAG: hypothetical protein HDR79_07080 [Bacteroides sp.]|nr:hypothetical protein [Bacteroides sp.]